MPRGCGKHIALARMKRASVVSCAALAAAASFLVCCLLSAVGSTQKAFPPSRAQHPHRAGQNADDDDGSECYQRARLESATSLGRCSGPGMVVYAEERRVREAHSVSRVFCGTLGGRGIPQGRRRGRRWERRRRAASARPLGLLSSPSSAALLSPAPVRAGQIGAERIGADRGGSNRRVQAEGWDGPAGRVQRRDVHKCGRVQRERGRHMQASGAPAA